MALDGLYAEGRIARTGKRRWVVKKPFRFGLTSMEFILQILAGSFTDMLRDEDTWALQHGLQVGVAKLNHPIAILPAWELRDVLPSPSFFGQPLRGILLYGNIKPRVLRQYEKLTVPVVLVDRPGGSWKLHSMAVDNEKAAHDATVRLVQRGHRHIAFVRRVHLHLRDVDDDSRGRQKGFLRACREHGLRGADGWVYNSFSKDTTSAAWLQRLLAPDSPFTAVIGVDPGPVGLVMKAARETGRSVPEDLSIVSFQGKSGRQFSGPRTDFFELGRRAAMLLESPPRPPRHESLPCSWYEGRTLADARKR
jgi:DNA-binding LacI/PurR family transcriptional regulator